MRGIYEYRAAVSDAAFFRRSRKLSGETTVTAFLLWSTDTDELVPIRNSILFSAALCRAGVSQEVHIYSVGEHGLSLANAVTEDTINRRVCPDCEGWIDMAGRWLKRQFGV